MPKPFPFPFNVGTDICFTPRILHIIQKKTWHSFIRRFFTEKEREHYKLRVEQPLRTWHHTISAKEHIKQKQKELGVTDTELKQCIKWKREGKFGAPSDWLLELRAKFKATNVSGAREFKDVVDIGTNSGINSKVAIGHNLESGDALLESSTPVPVVDENLDGQPAEDIQSAVKPSDRVLEMETIKQDIVEEAIDYDDMRSRFPRGPDDTEKLSDLDMMFHLLEENEAATATAETSIRGVARFLAGRYVV